MISEAVTEVMWSGNLPDENFEEFLIQVRLPNKAGQTLYFPTVRECETGVERWIEIPAAGRRRRDYSHPAPSVTLTPKRN